MRRSLIPGPAKPDVAGINGPATALRPPGAARPRALARPARALLGIDAWNTAGYSAEPGQRSRPSAVNTHVCIAAVIRMLTALLACRIADLCGPGRSRPALLRVRKAAGLR
jgi:hypothetical protein